MGEAAKISLKAIGKQDTHLISNDPEDSLFKYKLNQYSHFTKFYKSKVVVKPNDTPTWPFGETIKVEFNPTNMGDLLSDMWIKLKLPGEVGGGNYPDQVSLHIIKSITMYVDEIKVEELTDDWNFIYNELYLSDTQRDAVQLLTNSGFRYTYFTNGFTDDGNLGEEEYHRPYSALAGYNREVLIPLHFFFSRRYKGSGDRHYFPLCSIYKQKITFEINFHKTTFFTSPLRSYPITIPDFTIITEEIKLIPEERLYLTSSTHSFETGIASKHIQQRSEVNNRILKTNFSTDKPVKILHWFYRQTEYEDENDNSKYEFRFNFASSNFPFKSWLSSFFVIADKINIYLNGEPAQNISGDQNHRYFKYYTPYESGLNTPRTHIYTYNASLYPSIQQRSGILDFSKIISDKSFIETRFQRNLDLSKTYEMHVYHIAYTRLEFRDGFMNIVY
jgi:hypothetical protein